MKSIFNSMAKFLHSAVITPIGKAIYAINEKISGSSKSFENWLTKKTTLLFVSLLLSIVVFIVVDQKIIVFTESSAEIINDLSVEAIYNEEAFVVEGIPESVDLTLVGRRSELMFAKQASDYKVTVDLTGLTAGTHRVKIEYKQALPSITHSVNPSVATVVIYPKISEVKNLSVDVLNQDVLSEEKVISNLRISSDSVIVKGAEKDLKEVAVVKALVDLKNLASTDVGETILKGVPLVAYDSRGQIIDVELEPNRVDATMSVESPSKEVPIRVKPLGRVGFGKAISSIEMSSSRVTIYGSDEALESINFIEVEVDVEGIQEDREFRVELRNPIGVRTMSSNSVTVNIKLGDVVEREIPNVNIEYRNLGTDFSVQGLSESDIRVVVGVQGVESVVANINAEDVRAFLDLAGLTEGEHEVEVKVEGSDVRVNYLPKTRRVTVRIVKR